MKDKIKGKMVKTQRGHSVNYESALLICGSCYWEGAENSAKKSDKGLCLCPECNTVLDNQDEWDFKF